jgi:hypothetical protein
MFGSFSADLLEDCDYIDSMVDQVTDITRKDTELNSPEAQRIMRLYDDSLQGHQKYEDMVAQMEQRLAKREDWQRCVSQTAFDDTREAYTTS